MKRQGMTPSRGWRSGWILGAVLAALASGGCGEPRQNVRIILPENGDRFVQGPDTIVFQAQLGTLDPTNPYGIGAVWASSLDGTLRRDELEFELPADSLSVGDHFITVIVPVRDGWVQDDVEFAIEAGASAR